MATFEQKRARLIKLLKVDMSGYDAAIHGDYEENLADYLLANGVDVAFEKPKEVVPVINVSRFESMGFSELQLQEIKLGIRFGVSDELIDMYANPMFNHYQMREIRIGFVNGLTKDQVSVYARSEFNEEQMNVIRVGLELGMTDIEIAEMAKPEYSWQQMYRIRNKIRRGDFGRATLDKVIINAKKHNSLLPNKNSKVENLKTR